MGHMYSFGSQLDRLLLSQVVPISCLGSIYRNTDPLQLRLSVLSLMASNIRPSQFVLVVDGPITESLELELSYYCDRPMFSICRLSQNLGLGPALRAGLDHCLHDVVCRFDTDDISDPSRISTIYKLFFSRDMLHVDVMSSPVIEFIESKSKMVTARLKSVPLDPFKIRDYLFFRNTVNHPAVAFRKSSIARVGSYENIRFFEDYYLWLKCRKYGLQFFTCPYPLVYMRRCGALPRRSGLLYMLREVYFVYKVMRNGLAGPLFLLVSVFRLSSRLLPSRLQCFQDLLPWRDPLFECVNPESRYFKFFNLESILDGSQYT